MTLFKLQLILSLKSQKTPCQSQKGKKLMTSSELSNQPIWNWQTKMLVNQQCVTKTTFKPLLSLQTTINTQSNRCNKKVKMMISWKFKLSSKTVTSFLVREMKRGTRKRMKLSMKTNQRKENARSKSLMRTNFLMKFQVLLEEVLLLFQVFLKILLETGQRNL